MKHTQQILSAVNERLRNLFIGYEDSFILIAAIVIGALAGASHIIIYFLIGIVQWISFGSASEFALNTFKNTPAWKLILMPALGGLTVGLISFIFNMNKGHGIPNVMRSIAQNRVISPFTASMKTGLSAITMGTGGSTGSGGPVIQMGAALGSGFGKLFKFSSSRMRTIAACGAAGGLAATFNAPIAGAMFAAEVLLVEFGIKSFSPILVSSVIATATSRWFLGNNVIFTVPEYQLVSTIELPLYAIMGVLCAFVGVLFIRVFYLAEDKFEAMPTPVWLKPAIGGLMVGCIGAAVPEVLGIGYDTMLQVLHGEQLGLFLSVIVIMKIIAISLTLSSGGSGGVLLPSIFIGAVTGGFFGWGVNTVLPSVTAGSGAYALVAMSAMFAAVVRAPMTAILIVFEITQSYTVIIPLMITTIVAYTIAHLIEKESIFTWVLAKQGVKIKKGLDETVLESITVKEVMSQNVTVFRENTPFRDILNGIRTAPHMYFPVLDENHCMVGMISLMDIKDVLFEEGLEDLVVAGDICRRKSLIYLEPEDSLITAMEKLGIKDLEALPVVEQSEYGLRFLGLLRRGDMIVAYNKRAGMDDAV